MAAETKTMIFLVEYNQNEGRIVTFRGFDESQRREAEAWRLKIELELNLKGIRHEVVLLEAENEEAIHKTHRRYFGDFGKALQQQQKEWETSQKTPTRSVGK